MIKLILYYKYNTMVQYKMIITSLDKQKCSKFCRDIIKDNENEDQFNRIDEPVGLRRFRTCMGKLGELYIHKSSHLLKEGNLDTFSYMNEMFEVYEGTNNVDEADFMYKDQTVDVKTIYAYNHNNIIIPVDQPPKDIYIGVKIHTHKQWAYQAFHQKSQGWEKNIVNMYHDILDFSCIGFIYREDVIKAPVKNFGNNAYFVPIKELNNDKSAVELILSSLLPAKLEQVKKHKLK